MMLLCQCFREAVESLVVRWVSRKPYPQRIRMCSRYIMMYRSIHNDYCYTDVITNLENVQLVLNFSGGLRFNSTESY